MAPIDMTETGRRSHREKEEMTLGLHLWGKRVQMINRLGVSEILHTLPIPPRCSSYLNNLIASIIRMLKQKMGFGTEQQSPTNNCSSFFESGKHRRTKARILTMGSLLKELKLLESRLPVDGNGRVRVRNPLGQYLLDAARLYEGMSNYRDKKLLRKYLCADPPLHPRRTLDQAYHWTLNSTWHRDRDQVVYRHTTTKPEDFHRYDHHKGEWVDHKEFGIQGKCDECSMNIKKLSRVVMVDQLWMWILDAKTIITCFPKRYGANKQDTSAIHKSIRVHLQDNSGDQIRTVFDLALVIIDECSNTFFDRTKTGDRQPLVLDAFSKAIGNIVSIARNLKSSSE